MLSLAPPPGLKPGLDVPLAASWAPIGVAGKEIGEGGQALLAPLRPLGLNAAVDAARRR